MKENISILIVFILLIANGCSDTSTNFQQDTVPEINESRFGEGVANENTRVLSDSTLQKLESVSEDGLVFHFKNSDQALEDLENGTILAAGISDQTPLGVLRKVVSVEESNNDEIKITTTNVSLEEVFKRLDLQISNSLNASDIQSAKLKIPSRGVEKDITQKVNVYSDHIGQSFDEVIYGDDNFGITLKGSIKLNPTYQFDLEISRSEIELFSLSMNQELESELSIDGTASWDEEYEKIIFEYKFTPITFFVGPIPIVFTPTLAIPVKLNGTIASGIGAGVTAVQTFSTGISYSQQNWEESKNFQSSFTPHETMPSANANLNMNIGPEFIFFLYDIAGPYVNVSGYSELKIDIGRSPLWQLYAGLEIVAGAKVEFLSRELEAEERILVDFRELIAEGPESQGIIVGTVRDAITNDPISQVTVQLRNIEDYSMGTTTSNDQGKFEFSTSEDSEYTIFLSKEGYLSDTYSNIEVVNNETTFLEPVLQIDEEYSGIGSVSGRIFNALDGVPVQGVDIILRKGINERSGTVVSNTRTNGLGEYSFMSLEAGNYTAEISGDGYVTTYFTLVSIGGINNDEQNGVVSPEIGDDNYRIVLTWGETPRDLDSHLTGPINSGERFHVFYANKNASPYANLDLDDVTSFGPETVTITEQISGTYRYSVHNYTDRSSNTSDRLSKSDAIVRVFKGDQLVKTFSVPQNTNGTLWTVFELENNSINSINSLGFVTDPGDVFKVNGTHDLLLFNLPQKN